jgi:mycothiol system anti-sigma-R factor
MSCGNHHDTDCSEVLLKVYDYLDGEMGPDDCRKIKQHLNECGHCLKEYDIDQMLKALVRRSCGSEHAPAQLRLQIIARITSVRVELSE